jgi:hypothetical protein
MPENPRDLSTFKGFRYRRLNRQAASRLVELFQVTKCSICGAPLEAAHIRMLLSESDLQANGIEPAGSVQFDHAHRVWVPGVQEPILFCESDYRAWLDPASRRNHGL